MSRSAVAVDVELVLNEGVDPRAPGGEVTVSLCGHWDHDGPCRWPHNNRLESTSSPARLRTVLVVTDPERDDVCGRIEGALRADDRWSVISFATGAIRADEEGLAERLARVR